jgi:hypothetical protein
MHTFLHRIASRTKTYQFPIASVPIAVFVLCLVTYGLLIPWLGFYWDDWPYTWFAHILGPGGFIRAFAHDRPFLSLIYMLTTPVFGQSPFAWQIFALVTRFLTVIALWWTLRLVWKDRIRPVLWTVLLFAVYPGFGQQWISVIYSQAFIILTSLIISLGCSAWAIRKPRLFIPVTILGLFTSAFNLFSTEYFFGLELLRPLLIWIVFNQSDIDKRKRIISSFLHWILYLFLWLGYAGYRFFLLGSNTYKGYELQGLNISGGAKYAFFQVFESVIDTFSKAGLEAWTQALKLFTQPLNSATTWLSLGIVVISFMMLCFYMIRVKIHDEEELSIGQRSDSWAGQAILLGLAGIILGRFPSWIAGLPISLEFPWDRFMLSTMLGASLFLAGLVDFFVKTDLRKIAVFSLIISLSIGKQFQTANTFRRAWEAQRDFFWQLSWRIPGMVPGTLLLTHELPLLYYSDYSLSAPLNMTYSPDLTNSSEMPYLLMYTKARLDGSLPSLAEATHINFDYRAMTFTGTTSRAIVIYLPAPGCLRVMDRVFTDSQSLGDIPYPLANAIPLTRFKWIISDPLIPAQPPDNLFGPEPTHSWCYYFQKAELARQQEKYDLVLDYLKQSEALELTPLLASEYYPFVEAYARTHQWNQALELSRKILSSDPKLKTGVCNLVFRITSDLHPDAVDKTNIEDFYTQIGCPY